MRKSRGKMRSRAESLQSFFHVLWLSTSFIIVSFHGHRTFHSATSVAPGSAGQSDVLIDCKLLVENRRHALIGYLAPL
jgi:hypothetical protein